jgi:hypothetical protein
VFGFFAIHQLGDAYGLLIAWTVVARATLSKAFSRRTHITIDWLFARTKDADALIDTIEISKDAFV